jgi:hypothetical protein
MDSEIPHYNLVIASDYLYDTDFIEILEKSAHQHSLSTYVVRPPNLEETYIKLLNKEIGFDFYYDRASDSSPEFLKLYQLVVQAEIPRLESMEFMCRAADKATMHLEFISNGIFTPYTIIIPPFTTLDNISLTIPDLAKLGRPFIIKPANTTGGGIGVVDGAETLSDVLRVRQQYHSDKYLLQEKITPLFSETKRFWFRVFYVCGKVICTWWSDITHVYELLTDEEIERFQLEPLFSIGQKIATICQLNFFSTEIALTSNRQFIVIDYVNEICDMRLKSHHYDGVPDEVVQQISTSINNYVKEKISHPIS